MIAQIDTSQIQSADIQQLSSTFLTAVKKFYSDPQNLKNFENFEDWKKQKNHKEQK